jgi:undecaprenyl pyrophosphate phosphatase UppP
MTVALGVHAGTALSVLVLYSAERSGGLLCRFLPWHSESATAAPRWPFVSILTSIPAAVVGFAASDAVEHAFSSPLFAGIGFLISGSLSSGALTAYRRGSQRSARKRT